MLNWQTIDTVLLDMDGTLLDLHFDNHFWLDHLPRRYADIHGTTEAAAREHLRQRLARERGTLNWYCTDYWSDQLRVDIVALKHEVRHLIAVRPFAEQFLHRLKQQGRRAVLVTNAHRDSLSLKLAATGIDRWLDGVVSSHDYRRPKEDPCFWAQLHTREPFEPGNTLLIDDTETVLRAAQQFGVGHLLTVQQPDSKAPRRAAAGYPSFHHFDEIMPAGGGAGAAGALGVPARG